VSAHKVDAAARSRLSDPWFWQFRLALWFLFSSCTYKIEIIVSIARHNKIKHHLFLPARLTFIKVIDGAR